MPPLGNLFQNFVQFNVLGSHSLTSCSEAGKIWSGGKILGFPQFTGISPEGNAVGSIDGSRIFSVGCFCCCSNIYKHAFDLRKTSFALQHVKKQKIKRDQVSSL